MKTSIGILVVLLVTAGLALPGWVGGIAEQRFTEQMESSPVPGYLTVEVVDYRRGWFESTGRVEIELSDSYVDALMGTTRSKPDDAEPDGDGARLEQSLRDNGLELVVELTHGPLGYRDGWFAGLSKTVMRLQPPSEQIEAWRRHASMPYLLEARLRMGFDGVVHVDAEVPAIDYRDDDVGHVVFSGFIVQGRYEPGGHVVSHGGIDELRITGREADVRVEAMTFDSDNTIASEFLWLGAFGVGIGRVAIESSGVNATRLELSGLRMTSDVSAMGDGTKIDSTFGYYIDSIAADDVNLADAKLVASLTNVDVATFEAYSELSQQLMLEAEGSSDQSRAVTDLLHAFLRVAPVLEIDPLAFKYNGEPFSARLRMTVDPSVLPSDPANLVDRALWMQLIVASAEAEASKALVRTLMAENMKTSMRAAIAQQGATVAEERIERLAEKQAAAMLANLIERGYITENGSSYGSELNFESGKLTINGQAIRLPGAS